MSRDSRGAGRKGRGDDRSVLKPDDAELWRVTASTVHRIARIKPRVPDGPALDALARAPAVPPPQPEPAPTSRSRATPAPATSSRPAKPAAGPPPPPAMVPIERRKARRIATGRIEIEARLDLHGLTQETAHRRLATFLRDCQAQGLATVLVITGKGGPPGARDGDRDPDAAASNRGVLKRMVPRWLDEPGLRAMVVSHGTAAIRHGGSGALYVQLRRNMRPGR